MPFPGHLDVNRIQELTTAAVEAGVPQIERALRLVGISPLVVGAMELNPAPNTQLMLDLNNLNMIERMPDGQIPVVQLLKNIAFQLRIRGRPDKADLFERAANQIGNRESGVPPLPAPQELPEVQEIVVGLDDMVDYGFLARGNDAGRSVARILVPRFENGAAVKGASGGPWIMSGTAWLVAPRIVMTNHHVVNARKQGEGPASDADFALQGKNASVEFDFDAAGATSADFGVEAVVAKSNVLDYALLRLKKDAGRSPLRLSKKRLEVSVAKRPALNIIQHPRGETKRVAFRNNLGTWADVSTVRYFTDTDHGSSGSPVCDDGWRVVALHRGALPAENVKFQGKSEAYVNFGSQIVAIIDDLAQSVRAEILAAQPA